MGNERWEMNDAMDDALETNSCAVHPRSVIISMAVFLRQHRQMINGKRIAVVLPAYNAEKTLEATIAELPDIVDIKILVDDYSSDQTVELARRLGLHVF